jgi:hypothetical protein
MKNKTCLIILVLLLLLSVYTYSSANFEITPDIDTLIPKDALMYFHISDPDELIISLDNFLKATGMNMLIEEMQLKEFITTLPIFQGPDFSLDYLNLSNPIGIAILPAANKNSDKMDVEFMLLIPINTSLNILDLIKNRDEAEDILYKIYMNYLVYFSSEKLKDNFPSNNIVDLSNMDKYDNDSLNIYYDIQGLFETFAYDISGIMKEFQYDNSWEMKLTERIMQGYFKSFSQIDSLFSNIKLYKRGITLENDMFFSGNTESLLASFKNSDDIKKWAAYIPENGTFQYIYSINSEDYQLIMGKILNYLFPETEDDQIMLELKQNMKIFSQYIGNGGAFSIDIIPTLNKTENNEQILPFSLSLSMVSELSDSDAYVNEFRNFYSSQSVNNLMNTLSVNSGYKFKIIMEEQTLNNLSPVFKLKYDISEKRTKSSRIGKEADPIMNFLNNIEIWYNIAEGKMYSYIGPKGIDGLENLIKSHEPEREWVNAAPTNSNFIWNFSLTNFLKLLNTLPEFDGLIPKNSLSFDISGFTGIENGSLYNNTSISSKDIRNIFNLFKNMDL